MKIQILREGQLIHDIEGGNLLEIFLVTSVASILGIRFFLAMTGYPQIGRGGLHIAHVLVGGVFMMIAIIILLAFLNKYSRYLAAVLGGFGFGGFLDELGKFLTRDNNYFFQPTIGLIYITFILIYFLGMKINSRKSLTPEERLINVLELFKEAVLNNMSARERQLAFDLLEDCAPSDPVVKELKDLLGTIESLPASKLEIYVKAKEEARNIYQKMVRKRWFTTALMAFFLLQAIILFLESLHLTVGLENAVFFTAGLLFLLEIYRAFKSKPSMARKIICGISLPFPALILLVSLLNLTLPTLPVKDWLHIGFTALAGIYVVAGILSMRKNRLKAYNHFKSALLIYIFFVQVFIFFDIQFYGLLGLGMNILTLWVLRYMIDQETSISGGLRPASRDYVLFGIKNPREYLLRRILLKEQKVR